MKKPTKGFINYSFLLSFRMMGCALLLFLLPCVGEAQLSPRIDSLLVLVKAGQPDTNKVNLLNKLCDEYSTIGEYDKALHYGNSALQIAQQLNFEKGIAISYNIIGNLYFEQGNYPEALKTHFLSLKIREATDDKDGIARSFINIGNVNYVQGNYPEALKNYLASLKIRETIGNKKHIADSYNNIGNVYNAQSNYPEALKFLLISLKIKKETGDKAGVAGTYNNIGNVYYAQGNYPEALKTFLTSLEMKKETGDKAGIVRAYNNIGSVYSAQGNYPEALKIFLIHLKIKEEMRDKAGIAVAYCNIGDVFRKQNKYKEAEEYLIKAKNLSKEIGRRPYQREVYNSLTKLDSARGNFKGAYENHKLYILYRDSLDNEETRKKTVQRQMTHDFERKESLAKLEQDKKDAIAGQIKQKQRMAIYFISAGLVLLLFFILFIIRGYRQKIRSNAIIALKNEEIASQKANITGQEEERKRIAQELHDGIGGTLAGTRLNLLRINTCYTIPELESVITNIGDACKEIRTISHNLAPPALSTNSSFVDVMKELIHKFTIPGKRMIHFEYFPAEEINDIGKDIQAEIYRIVQELLANITKHAHAGKVEIDISKQENELFLLVEDNGRGFDLTATRKGIGLQNIESRVKLLDGKMIIDSKAGRGTAVNIHIPLADKRRNTIFV